MGRYGVLGLALVGALCVGLGLSSSAAARPALETVPGERVVVRAAPGDAGTHVPAPPRRAAQAATITVTYNGFSTQARAAFQAAVDIWAGQITSGVPIAVEATWEPLPTGVLGAAGPAFSARNFTGAPVPNTFYPAALANRLSGSDLDPTGPDIYASFNSAESDWYYGTDGQTPAGKYDLETVVLHELGHGLGFTGDMSFDTSTGLGTFASNGVPRIFDRFVVNTAGLSLITLQNGSLALGAQLVGGGLYLNGTNAMAAAGGTRPRLYAPTTWQEGSSVYHLDQATYPAGNANSLMTPALMSAAAIHDPGPIVRGLFQDMGWTTSAAVPTATPTLSPTVTPVPISIPVPALPTGWHRIFIPIGPRTAPPS